jgi:hypothetical protein
MFLFHQHCLTIWKGLLSGWTVSLLPFRTYISLFCVLLGQKVAVSAEIFKPIVNYIRVLIQSEDRDLRNSCFSCLSSIALYCNFVGRLNVVSANSVLELLYLISVNSVPDLKLIIMSIEIMANIAYEQEQIDYLPAIFSLPLKKKMNC